MWNFTMIDKFVGMAEDGANLGGEMLAYIKLCKDLFSQEMNYGINDRHLNYVNKFYKQQKTNVCGQIH